MAEKPLDEPNSRYVRAIASAAILRRRLERVELLGVPQTE